LLKNRRSAGKPFGRSAAMVDLLARQRGLQARGNGFESGHEDRADNFTGDLRLLGDWVRRTTR